MQFGDIRLPERFWRKVAPEPMSGCWLWTASLDTSGYGCFGKEKTRGAHRIAYKALIADPGDDLVLDHVVCQTRCCVNPDHLEPVTSSVNILRGVGSPALNARKTTCKHGHPLTPENVYLRDKANGRRECFACIRVRIAKRGEARAVVRAAKRAARGR